MDLDFTKGHIFMEARVSDSMMKKVVFFLWFFWFSVVNLKRIFFLLVKYVTLRTV